MAPSARWLEVVVHREGEGTQGIVACVIDTLQSDLEARRRWVLVVRVDEAREEDRGEGEREVSTELIAIDRHRVGVCRATPRLPLIGARDAGGELLPTAEDVASLDSSRDTRPDEARRLTHEGRPEVGAPGLVLPEEDHQIERADAVCDAREGGALYGC